MPQHGFQARHLFAPPAKHWCRLFFAVVENNVLVCFVADEKQLGSFFAFYDEFGLLIDTFPERINCAAQTKFLAILWLNNSNLPLFLCVIFQPTLKGVKRARKQHILSILAHICECAHHELVAYFQPRWKYIWSGSIQYSLVFPAYSSEF